MKGLSLLTLLSLALAYWAMSPAELSYQEIMPSFVESFNDQRRPRPEHFELWMEPEAAQALIRAYKGQQLLSLWLSDSEEQLLIDSLDEQEESHHHQWQVEIGREDGDFRLLSAEMNPEG